LAAAFMATAPRGMNGKRRESPTPQAERAARDPARDLTAPATAIGSNPLSSTRLPKLHSIFLIRSDAVNHSGFGGRSGPVTSRHGAHHKVGGGPYEILSGTGEYEGATGTGTIDGTYGDASPLKNAGLLDIQLNIKTPGT
jgi:hypothetical protein